MGSIVVTNDVKVTILIDGQDKASLMWTCLDYALNNNTNFTDAQRTELSAVRDALATDF